MKKFNILILISLLTLILAACGSNDSNTKDDNEDDSNKETITFGATTGPYSDMVNKAIKPLLEEKGYDVENIEFSDYVQPNNALDNGDIDANLFQHKIYYEAFAEENNMDLAELIIVPNAQMGLFSNKFNSVEEIEDGGTVNIAKEQANIGTRINMI